jgi:predicted nucleic acid-binding protein
VTTPSGQPYIYDAGALIAAERGDRTFRARHDESLREERWPIVPTPVLTQVWRGGARQARLSMTLHGCDIEPTSEKIALAAGVLLRHSSTGDAVDAIVVATATAYEAIVVTSDPDDLHAIADAAPEPLLIELLVV